MKILEMDFIERRKGNKRTKMIAFTAVTAVFLLVKVVGATHPVVDQMAHYAIGAFLAARIFLRGV